MADEFCLRPEGMVHPLSGNRDEARIADHMGVGHDPLAKSRNFHDESRSGSTGDMPRIPRGAVIGVLNGSLNAHDARSEFWKR
jgi:hypothetical protein